MKNMKILNVNFTFGTLTQVLNDELFNLIELKKAGHDVVMVTSDAGSLRIRKGTKNEDLSTIKEDKLIEILGISTYVLRSTLPQIGWYCSGANRLAKKIIKDFDVVYIHNWYDHLPFVFSKIAYEQNIPYVFNPHGTIHSEARKKYKREIKWIIDKIYTKKMINNASALHATGESEKIEFLKMGANIEKIFRIDPTVVKENFKIKKRTKILENLNIDKISKPYILFLGRIHEKKGIEILLEVFSKIKLNNLTLIIAGTGDEKYTKEIKDIIHKLGLKNRVKLTGYVIGDEKLQLLESAKIYILPSYSDVHPVSITEAIMMKTPVLVTKNCDYPEVEEYNVGIIRESNIKSIHEGLQKMLDNEEQLKIFSNNTKKLIEEKFDFNILKIEKMFEYAVNNKI
jgi:glycosyltransferase involved in cell wall biosynthesis